MPDKTIEELIAEITRGLPNELVINFNDHWGWGDGSTVQDTITQNELDLDDFSSAEDMQACIDTDSLWSVQYYPITHIGFYRFFGSTLRIVLERMAAAVPGY